MIIWLLFWVGSADLLIGFGVMGPGEIRANLEIGGPKIRRANLEIGDPGGSGAPIS